MAQPETAASTDLDEQLCFSLYAASRAMTGCYRPQLDAIGLTYPQYLVMIVLWEQDGITVSDIGARLFLDSATLTPLLKRMEQAELITRQRAASDERQVIVTLTPAGSALREQARSIGGDLLCATACDLPTVIKLKEQVVALRDNLMKNS